MKKKTSKNSENRKKGQVLVLALFILVILTFIALFNFDLHKMIFSKSRLRTAGDSSALMAGRWQGISLNLIGDLNLMHAIALSVDPPDAETCDAIVNTQHRICYVGPMVAFSASQQAAKNNKMYNNDDFTEIIAEQAMTVATLYRAVSEDGSMLFPEPYPGCWLDYSRMLMAIAEEGVAAAPDNAKFYTDYTGGHILLDIGFYQAIAGRQWCWFHHNAPSLLEDYEEFFPCWWDPLPDTSFRAFMNSEIFGLGLAKLSTELGDMVDLGTLNTLSQQRGLSSITSDALSTNTAWFCYSPTVWRTWDVLPSSSAAPSSGLPMTGTVKPQYNYWGADAVTRTEMEVTRLTPGSGGSTNKNTLVWTSAAKPFGYLNQQNRPNEYGVVLPAFRDVRLIPIDASSTPSGGAFNIAWREHIKDHLPIYMENGPTNNGCSYCRQLNLWENTEFRESGVEWLENYSYLCQPMGGGGIGGGTSIGH